MYSLTLTKLLRTRFQKYAEISTSIREFHKKFLIDLCLDNIQKLLKINSKWKTFEYPRSW